MKNQLRSGTLALTTLIAGFALVAGCATSPENLTEADMTLVSQQVVLKAPIDKAWVMLRALGDVEAYDPVVEKSSFLTEQTEGVGAVQHLVQDNGTVVIDARVTEWNEGRSISLMSERIEGIPMTKFTVTMALAETPDGTTLTTHYHYAMSGIAAILPTQGAVAEGLRRNLLSFKHAIETGERVADLETFKKKVEPQYASLSTELR